MSDNQIGSNVLPRGERPVDRVRVPDLILECPAAIMRLGRRASLRFVRDILDATHHRGRPLRHERTAETVMLDEMMRDVPELRWKILVNE